MNMDLLSICNVIGSARARGIDLAAIMVSTEGHAALYQANPDLPSSTWNGEIMGVPVMNSATAVDDFCLLDQAGLRERLKSDLSLYQIGNGVRL